MTIQNVFGSKHAVMHAEGTEKLVWADENILSERSLLKIVPHLFLNDSVMQVHFFNFCSDFVS